MAVEVALESSHGTHVYASTVVSGIGTEWQNYRATLHANATDSASRLTIRLQVHCHNIIHRLLYRHSTAFFAIPHYARQAFQQYLLYDTQNSKEQVYCLGNEGCLCGRRMGRCW